VRERVAFVIVFVSLLFTSAPALVKLARRAWEALPLDEAQRRGPMFTSTEALRKTPEPLALICDPNETDPALFVNYYLYPRRTRIYKGIDNYRNSANDPSRPRTIVAVRSSGARLTTYEAMRDERLRGFRVMHAALPAAPRAFNVPLVGSLDGPLTDTYVTEADFACDLPATVRMTLFPQRMTKTFTIAPRSTTSFYDLVYQNYRVMAAGWLRVESDQPLRASMWLVNRGRNDGVAIPLVTQARSGTIRCPGGECSLWLVNFGHSSSVAHVNGTPVVVQTEGVVSLPLRGAATVDGPNIFAYAGTRGGKLAIGWPP
jgi:hypothetical protein